MSHRRKRNDQRKERARQLEIRTRRQRPQRRFMRRVGKEIARQVQMFNQFALLAVGLITASQASIPWTSDLVARAWFLLYGAIAFAALVAYRRMIR